MEESSKNDTPKWLKHLQENSWEAEILISGGAIFSLFQISDLLISFRQSLSETSHVSGTGTVIILIVLILVLRGVTIGFIIHLFLRVFWIGMVCLRSAYPEGINFQKLNIRNQYLNAAKKINLTDQIIRIDKWSGLIFITSFLFIIIFVGVIPVLYILLSAPYFFNLQEWVLLIIVFPYLLDLFTSGLLRKNKVIGRFYAPVYSFFNFITLGFIYRPFLERIKS